MKQMATSTYKHIHKYQVIRLVRSTGSADLYECFDPALRMRVALKMFKIKKRLLNKLPYSQEQWRTRFIREARLLARIDHPHVVNVKELGEYEGNLFYVMPFIETCLTFEMGLDGERDNYAVEIQHAPDACALTVERSVQLLLQISSALTAFHRRNLVHRDLKPGNILLTRLHDGIVKLCDPGLVKFPNTDESQAGYWIGTEDYIAPEQKKDARNVDARADIYALGVLGYRMLSGALPQGAFKAPHELNSGIPEEISRFILSSLSPDKMERPEDGFSFQRQLKDLQKIINK